MESKAPRRVLTTTASVTAICVVLLIVINHIVVDPLEAIKAIWTRPKDALVLTDSLGKRFGQMPGSVVHPYPGATIGDIEKKIPNLSVSKYKVVLLLVGTNDLAPKSIWQWYVLNKGTGHGENLTLPVHKTTPIEDIAQDYRKLLRTIREANKEATILVSSLLPRVYDFKENNGYLISVNKELEKICNEHESTQFIHAYERMVTDEGLPKKQYFIKDGLHLSTEGAAVVQFDFERAIDTALYKMDHI